MHGVKSSRVQIFAVSYFAVLIFAFWTWVAKTAKIWALRKFPAIRYAHAMLLEARRIKPTVQVTRWVLLGYTSSSERLWFHLELISVASLGMSLLSITQRETEERPTSEF